MIVIAAAVVLLGLCIWATYRGCFKLTDRERDLAVIATFVLSLLYVLLSIPMTQVALRSTTGLMPDYGHGERIGYITKLSHKGVIWKTWEGQMQLGVGELASLQSAFPFSVPDPGVRKTIERYVGQKTRVRLKYRQWFLMPYRLGDSGYEIIAAEPVSVDEVRTE